MPEKAAFFHYYSTFVPIPCEISGLVACRLRRCQLNLKPASSIQSVGVLKRGREDRRNHARKNEIRAHPTVGSFCGSGVWAGATAGQNDYGLWTSDSLF